MADCEEKGIRTMVILFTILVWFWAISGLLSLLAISLGKPPAIIDFVMMSVSVVFFGSKIRRKYKSKKVLKTMPPIGDNE